MSKLSFCDQLNKYIGNVIILSFFYADVYDFCVWSNLNNDQFGEGIIGKIRLRL